MEAVGQMVEIYHNRTAQGQLNQDIAAQSDLVVLVTAGIPMVLKGQLPSKLS